MKTLFEALQPVRSIPLIGEAASLWHKEAEQAFACPRLLQHDREATFPCEAVSWLNQQDAQLLYLPVQFGGKLRSLTSIVTLWRALAMRDLTVAVGHGKTFLGAVSVWLGGNAQQIDQVRRALLSHEPVSWGLTERGRGADLMATQTTATPCDQGWRLKGEKWLINNATRGNMMTVLARTESNEAAAARNLSILLVDKRHLKPGSWRNLDKVSTYGVRGADISGQQWLDAELPRDAIIGNPGQGLELTLRALQLTRTACCGLSVGALDAGIKLTAELAQQHRLYGRRMIELDTVQSLLAESMLISWMTEVTAWIAARHASFMPQEMSIVSALAKAIIPSLVAQQLTSLEEQMGARGFISDLYADGAFQKLIRDHQIVPIFDGSTVVNRVSLVPQLPTLIRNFKKGTADIDSLNKLADMRTDLPETLPLDALTIFSRNGCSLIQALPIIIQRISQQHSAQITRMGFAPLLDSLLQTSQQIIDDLAAEPLNWPAVPQRILLGLQRYEWLFIAASCLLFWLNNPDKDNSLSRNKHWLPLCLTVIVRNLGLPWRLEQYPAWQSLKCSFADQSLSPADSLLMPEARYGH
ncbi:acyl-CoA dehydrogenase [Xenorhabdus khoisanae]|uniref:acyl-CoA dehydrogenase n=1 Tax=Xenorhabdus khoisanae TaxID=880157 RepID=UPI0032B85769